MNRVGSTRTYGAAIFLGAFLLFQVQPLIGKYVLPWFGGSPEVWTTCLLFFQALLLAGYTYAHCSARFLPPRAQGVLHVALLLAALAPLHTHRVRAPPPRWSTAGRLPRPP